MNSLQNDILSLRANPENPSTTLANPANWLIDWFGGDTSSGEKVTVDTAIGLPAVWSAAWLLSNTIASLPLLIYEKQKENRQQIAHSNSNLFSKKANSIMNAFTWKQTSMLHVMLWGNAYSLIKFEKMRPVELLPFHPGNVEVFLIKGKLWYKFRQDNDKDIWVDDSNVLHLRGISFDGIIGKSPVSVLRENLGLGLAAQKFGSKFYKKGARLDGVIEMEGQLSSPGMKNLRRTWKNTYEGPDGERVAILDAGMKYKQIGIPPEDSQFIETRKLSITDVARIFRIPPPLLYDLEKATFCLPADQEVYTSGGNKRISDLRTGDLLWSVLGDDISLKPVKNIMSTGLDEVLEIKTANRKIKCNAKHPILTRVRKRIKAENSGRLTTKWETKYIPAGKLSVGDIIVSLKKLPQNTNTTAPNGRKLNVDYMELLGLYMGDGYSMVKPKGGYIGIARASNASYMEHYRTSIKKEFTKTHGNGRGFDINVPVKLQEYERCTRFSTKHGTIELHELGFAGTAKTKKIPDWIFNISNDLRLAFLRGFLDADGSVDKKGRISFSSCNNLLLSQIRHLCIGLDVPVTNQRCGEGITTLPNGKKINFKQYCFTCSDPGSNLKIGSHTPHYIERMKSGKPFGKKQYSYSDKDHANNDFKSTFLQQSKITKITAVGVDEVFDIEVEDNHNFIANGVVVHNSNITELILSFTKFDLTPWLENIEQELNNKLFFESEKETIFAEFNMEGLLRGDSITRSNVYRTLIQNGVMTPAEARRRENWNGGIEKFYVPANYMEVTNTKIKQNGTDKIHSNGSAVN